MTDVLKLAEVRRWNYVEIPVTINQFASNTGGDAQSPT